MKAPGQALTPDGTLYAPSLVEGLPTGPGHIDIDIYSGWGCAVTSAGALACAGSASAELLNPSFDEVFVSVDEARRMDVPSPRTVEAAAGAHSFGKPHADVDVLDARPVLRTRTSPAPYSDQPQGRRRTRQREHPGLPRRHAPQRRAPRSPSSTPQAITTPAGMVQVGVSICASSVSRLSGWTRCWPNSPSSSVISAAPSRA